MYDNLNLHGVILDTNSAAQFLNVKVSWIRAAIFRKEIPFYKIGHLIRFKQSDLIDWLEKHKVSPSETKNVVEHS